MDTLNLLNKISLNYHQHDINDMGLADRINIHYKIGKFEKVSFETDEEYFVNQASKTETFQDVLELAEELYNYVQRQEEMITKLDDLDFGMGDAWWIWIRWWRR